MALTKKDILKADDIQKEMVNVPEWGGDIYLRTMSGLERDAFEQSIVKDKVTNLTNIRARFCALVICDEDGKRLFTDADVVELGRKSSLVLSRIFDVGQSLNGFTNADVEELAKNSESGQSDDSGLS